MYMDIMADKKEIRKKVLEVRNELSIEVREKAALLLTERVMGHQWFYCSEYFLCFVSYGSEIDTGELIGEALRAGKKVFVPKVLGQEMHFYRISGTDDLKPGYKGIPEPSGILEEYPYSPETAGCTLMLMPGVAFDRYRNRIGYGKGFYDRFLTDREALQMRTIAVGYSCQLVERLPAAETDIRPYQVICV